MRRTLGFTLLECLIALAILAVSLSAALRAVASSTQSLYMIRDHTLARWIAQNRLAELRATGAFPSLGASTSNRTQAGQKYVLREVVDRTPNPLFRKIQIQVIDDHSGRPLAEASGFVVRPLQ